MSYIGNTTSAASYAIDTFSGDGSTVNFTLRDAPVSTSAILVFVGGVRQELNTYSLSSTTLTFTGAPPSGTLNIQVVFSGAGTSVAVPSDGSVTTAKMASNITLTGNTTTSNLIVTGNTTTSNLTVTGNTTTGNLTATGNVTVSTSVAVTRNVSTSNIIVSNLTTTSNLLVTGNTTTGNLIVTGTIVSNVAGVGQFSSESTMGFKNRLINGAMVIDQRNAGASVTANGAGTFYLIDRFQAQGQSADGVFTVQQSTTAPTGFTNSLLATVTTADSSIGSTQYYFLTQKIEGFNTADLGFGTASASPVTLSFWVRSSVTGTFGGSLSNDGATRSYPFTYAISSANTWEQKSVTIAGDTSGTWLTTNGIGIRVYLNLGAGSSYTATAGAWASQWALNATGATNLIATNGATFYITGVQLEKGSTATSFDYRPIGTELALCQRYYEQSYSQGTIPAALTTVGAFEFAQQVAASSTQYGASCKFAVVKRTTPTMTFYNWNAAGNQAVNVSTGGVTSGITTRALGDSSFSTSCTTPAATLAGQTLSMHFTASAEL